MDKYWEQYNLECDPFSADPEQIAFFPSPQSKQLLELLQHLAVEGQLLTVVTGLSGIGKSLLLKQLLEQISDSAGVCKIQGDNSITTDVLRYLLAKHLGLAYSEEQKESFGKDLYAKLEEMQQNQQTYILAFDDAHLLPERTLSALLSMVKKQPSPHAPLHVILFGCPQLETAMADLALKYPGESLVHISRIKPFTLETTEQYMIHRLRQAGLVGPNPMTSEEINEIYQGSGGIPAKINICAREMLDMAPDERLPQYQDDAEKTASSWTNKIVALVVLLTLVSMSAIYFSREKSSVKLAQQDDVAQVSPVKPNQAVLPAETDANIASTAINADPEVVQQSENTSDSAVLIEDQEEDVKQPEVEAEEEKQLSHETASDQQVTKADFETHTVAKVAKPEKPAIVAKSVPAKPKAPSPALAKINKTPHEAQLLKIAPSHYTLQLMGSHDKAHLVSFVNRAGLQNKVKYFHTRHQGKDWYVVVLGDYSSQQKAQQAAKALPTYVQKQKPWARSVASVQQAIKTRGKA